MANPKRKTVGLGNLSFNKIDPYGQRVGQSSTPLMYSLLTISPDPNQPRHLIPTELSNSFWTGELTAIELVKQWNQLAHKESATPAIKRNWEALQQLAYSIEQQGLINPITIRPKTDEPTEGETSYLIVTGERRWWAHIWLLAQQKTISEGVKNYTPDQIKAIIITEGVSVRAHQLMENIVREDMGLIERALGMISLREELSLMAHSGEGKVKQVPWQTVESALGISRQHRIRILNVLELTEESQELIESYQLSERIIRPVIEKLKEYPALQTQALRQIIHWQQAEENGEKGGKTTSAATEQLVEKLLTKAAGATSSPTQPLTLTPAEQVKELQTKIRQTLRFTQHWNEQQLFEIGCLIVQNPEHTTVVEDLRQLRQLIDELLA